MTRSEKIGAVAEDFRRWGLKATRLVARGVRRWGMVKNRWTDGGRGKIATKGCPITYATGWTPGPEWGLMRISQESEAKGFRYAKATTSGSTGDPAIPARWVTQEIVLMACRTVLRKRRAKS